ncbi:hypothetical protein [Kribbella sp. VKM Ac-2568]|uniref:hypothetical protein n=1 Tax=Kribbella sp. VKM Ac-2568 TaxID=2512219 RepID=UPI00104F36C0|nr:hypothetical protein [Kribbella sp. VKM Ac-2568]TCM44900.1 hypothetical protein EV648_10752 [Kribbella sp. VKM Ac-2568]
MTSTTNHWDADSPPGPQHGAGNGVTGTAREEAGQLKETSADAARQVAGTVKEKASDVTSDVRQQTQRLAGQTRDQLLDQASQQKERATKSLRSVGDELRGMAEHGDSGLGAQLAQHGAKFTDQAADFLQQREPGDLLDEVRGYARRKPGTFLLVAVAAGVVAGRLTRALAAGATDAPSGTTNGRSTRRESVAYPVSDEYLVPPPSTDAPGSTAPTGDAWSDVRPGATPRSAPPVAPTTAPPPMPTPVAPDPNPGTPVTPEFGPGSER